MNIPDSVKSLRDGLLDGGGEVFTNFPGFMSQVLFEQLGGRVTSCNEKVAYEIAWGASFAGKRSAVMFKNVGLNVAADPFLNSYLSGVNAGLVLLIFDDMYVQGSQSRQDSRHYFDFFGGLWLEPFDLQSAYDLAKQSFTLSEKLKLPVVIRITNQLLNQVGEYQRKVKKTHKKKLEKNPQKYVVHPINWRYQLKQLTKKLVVVNKQIEEINSEFNKNLNWKNNLLKPVVICGCNDTELKNFAGKHFNKIQLVSYPLPKKLIKKFCSANQKVTLLEQGDKFAANKLRDILLNSKNIISETGYVPNLDTGYIISDEYRDLFYILNSLKASVIVGDLGLYTRDTLNTIDSCLCLGSSLGVSTGLLTAGLERVLTVTGDAAYLHSGKDAIPEAKDLGVNLKVVIICNGGSKVTGGQKVPGDLFQPIDGIESTRIRYSDLKKSSVKNRIKNFLDGNKPSILFVVI